MQSTEPAEKNEQLVGYLTDKLVGELGPEEPEEYGPERLQPIVACAVATVSRRLPEELLARLTTRPGNGGPVMVLELLLADQPFIVDTLRLNLRRLGLRERVLFHRLLSIDREEDGSIARFGAQARGSRESYVYVELPYEERSERRDEILSSLQLVFERLRHVVADHGRMVKRIREHTAELELVGATVPDTPLPVRELMDFLSWLADDNYVFFGYRRYDVARDAGGDGWRAQVDPESGLGLMRSAAASRFATALEGERIPELIRGRLSDPRLLFFDKSRTASLIHREGRLDCISVKELDETGKLAGFGRFIGLLTHKAIKSPASQIPILRRRRERLLNELGAEPGSHNYKAASEAFDSLPPEFLFDFPLSDVVAVVQRVLRVASRGGVETAVVPDPLNRSFFVSTILPRARYDEELRHELRALLQERYDANYLEHRSSFVDDEVALIHFFCTSHHDVEESGLEAIERHVLERATRWSDRFEACLRERHPGGEADRLAADYAQVFPEEYRTMTSASEACIDVECLERLRSGASRVEVEAFDGRDGAHAPRVRIYQSWHPYLTDLLPMLDNFDLKVVDATLVGLEGLCDQQLWVLTCRLEPDPDSRGDGACPTRVLEGLRAVLGGLFENGPINRLVLRAGLDWREVNLLRAYLLHASQLGVAPALRFATETLVRHPDATRALLGLFRARFDPDLSGDRDGEQVSASERLRLARDPVPTAAEDRVFALLQELVGATQRTNFFAESLERDAAIVIKVRTELIEDAPTPRPHAEIFVHSAELSGVHLRGGPIARGGIRWSDRVTDFRTEVLGLVKTQMVKNGLIVPVGAKGGFVLKRECDDRDQARAQADVAYVGFMRCLLSVTDSVQDGRAVPPPRVVRHDGDDPYLVVAPDKGTAHLSDVANQVSESSGYWLGDAFASGGSEGYDHKACGITARGAWVCVRRHFLEQGVDIDRDLITMAGIGDMSGDVFGNGLLLARKAKLLAAFNHLHVFLDPDPDPDISWQERFRLFELSRSGWDDYDPAKISKGGGVFDRNAKAVALSPEARRVLHVEAESLSGEELVRTILQMPVDLLWNGGIGTYAKASSETDAEVGDRANEAVRVDASEIRARVVGEGGNLGFTQAARVEFALLGGCTHTDAIDNSAGVDLSDHEVNFKVLLASRFSSGRMSRDERNGLLRSCTEEATASVLANNAAQSLCLSLDLLRSRENALRMVVAADFLARHAGLDLDLESLPDRDAVRSRRKSAGEGYTKPELAVLLGYTKMLVKRELVASDLPDHRTFEPLLMGYFPETLRECFGGDIATHPLRREITATALCNSVIDRAGVTLVPELCSALGSGIAEVVAAYHTMDRLLEADHLRFLIESREVSERLKLAASVRVERAVRGAARSRLGLERRAALEPEEFAHWTGLVRSLREVIADRGSCLADARLRERVDGWVEQGLDADLARRIEELIEVVRTLGVLSLTVRSVTPLPRVVEVHERIGRETGIAWLLERLADLDRREGWDRIAAESLHLEMLDAQRALTARLIESDSPAQSTDRFLAERRDALARIRETVARIEGEASQSLAPLAVVAQHIRRLG